MSECLNVDVRDLLPELLNERLPARERVRVAAHVAECVDCSSELALLRDTRGALFAATPAIDTAAIASAVQARLASPAAHSLVGDTAPALQVIRGDAPIGRSAARPSVRWASPPLRAAAAVVVMALGAGGVLVARRGADVGSASRVSVPAGSVAVSPSTAPATSPAATAPVASNDAEASGLRAPRVATASALGATFSDLSDDELAAVLHALDDGDASLPAEPAPTPAVVGTGGLQ